jgi:hypothetical protein
MWWHLLDLDGWRDKPVSPARDTHSQSSIEQFPEVYSSHNLITDGENWEFLQKPVMREREKGSARFYHQAKGLDASLYFPGLFGGRIDL